MHIGNTEEQLQNQLWKLVKPNFLIFQHAANLHDALEYIKKRYRLFVFLFYLWKTFNTEIGYSVNKILILSIREQQLLAKMNTLIQTACLTI